MAGNGAARNCSALGGRRPRQKQAPSPGQAHWGQNISSFYFVLPLPHELERPLEGMSRVGHGIDVTQRGRETAACTVLRNDWAFPGSQLAQPRLPSYLPVWVLFPSAERMILVGIAAEPRCRYRKPRGGLHANISNIENLQPRANTGLPHTCTDVWKSLPASCCPGGPATASLPPHLSLVPALNRECIIGICRQGPAAAEKGGCGGRRGGGRWMGGAARRH